MKLEEKLVSLRKAKGLSQLKLAEMMNVSRQAVSRWEVGTAIPSTDNLKYLGGLYGVPLEYLLYDDAPDPMQQGEEIREEKSKGNGWKWTLVLIAIAIVVVVFWGADFFEKKPQETVPMNDIEGSEIETDNINDFELDF